MKTQLFRCSMSVLLAVLFLAGCAGADGETVVGKTAVSPTSTLIPATETAVLTNTPILPTETAVSTNTPQPTMILPTGTPLPAPTSTPEPPRISALAELVGYWEYNGFETNDGGKLQYVYCFPADGILEIADSRRELESGEIKARVDFWFEEGVWHSQFVTGFWRAGNCFTGSEKPITGRYEIRPDR